MPFFENRVVVVPGATGVVGTGVVKSFLDGGATVIGISRSADRLGELRQRLGLADDADFHGLVGDFNDEQAAMTTRENLLAQLDGRPVDHIVAALGFVTMADAPTKTPFATVRQAMADGLDINVLAAKALMPLVLDREGATYTMVSGGFAHFTPAPSFWLGTLKNAAVNALTLGLAAEAQEHPLRVNTVCIHVGVAPIGGDQNQLGMPSEGDSLRMGPVFTGLAQRTDADGQVICITDWDVAAKWSA